MEKFTQKQLRALVASGAAVDVTHCAKRSDIPENYKRVGYAHGVNGLAGLLFVGEDSGKLYAITHRAQSIYIF